MNLQYFGTAAAEAVPAPFCECPVCQAARQKGGRNVRTRSQALVEGRLLLDFPPDTYLHVLNYGLRLWEVDSVLITHCHSDHIYPGDLWCLTDCAAHRKVERPFHLYGSAPTLELIRRQCEDTAAIEKRGALELHLVTVFQPFTVEGFRVTPLRADHGAPLSICWKRKARPCSMPMTQACSPKRAWTIWRKRTYTSIWCLTTAPTAC